MLKNKFYPLSGYLAAISIPLFLVISWHWASTLYPHDDAADYFKTTQQIYQIFESEGFIKGLEACYLHRGWRPTLFPVVAEPFILASKGNVLTTIASTMIFSFFVFMTYSYLFAREFLSPSRSIVCTMLLGTTYWIVSSTYYFFSEIWLYACAMGFLYYLKKSDFFSSSKYSILLGTAMGFGLASKPVELLMSLGIFLALYIYMAFKKQNLIRSDFFRALTIIMITAAFVTIPPLFIKPIKQSITLLELLILILILPLPLFLFKEKNRFSNFAASVFACCLIAGVWWLPAFYNYIDYIYTGGMGDMARLYNLGRREFLDALSLFFSVLGGYPLLFISIIAFTCLIFTKKKKEAPPLEFKNYLIIIIPMIVIPVLIMSLSPSTDYRRASLAFSVFILLTAILAIQPGLIFPKIRFALLTLLVSAQFIMISATTFGFNLAFFPHINRYIHGLPSPTTGGELSETTFQVLNKLPLGNASISAFTLTLSLHLNAGRERLFDPSTLQLLAEKHRSHLTFGYPWNFANLEEGYKALEREYSLVLLDVSNEPPPGLTSTEPTALLTIDLMNRWKNSTLAEVHLKELFQFSIKGKKLVLLRRASPEFLEAKGGIPGSNNPSQPGFPISSLGDGSETTVWGSAAAVTEDTIFYMTLPNPDKAKMFKIVLFSPPPGEGNIRDVSAVATNNPNVEWYIIKSRIGSTGAFTDKITIPNAPDKTLLTIELDTTDPNWREYTTFGLACFSGSRGYARNYVPIGNGIYARELDIF